MHALLTRKTMLAKHKLAGAPVPDRLRGRGQTPPRRSLLSQDHEEVEPTLGCSVSKPGEDSCRSSVIVKNLHIYRSLRWDVHAPRRGIECVRNVGGQVSLKITYLKDLDREGKVNLRQI